MTGGPARLTKEHDNRGKKMFGFGVHAIGRWKSMIIMGMSKEKAGKEEEKWTRYWWG